MHILTYFRYYMKFLSNLSNGKRQLLRNLISSYRYVAVAKHNRATYELRDGLMHYTWRLESVLAVGWLSVRNTIKSLDETNEMGAFETANYIWRMWWILWSEETALGIRRDFQNRKAAFSAARKVRTARNAEEEFETILYVRKFIIIYCCFAASLTKPLLVPPSIPRTNQNHDSSIVP
jgi:hypothetical protein